MSIPTCPNCNHNLIYITAQINWCEHCGSLIQSNAHMVPLVSRPAPKHTSVSLDGNGNSSR